MTSVIFAIAATLFLLCVHTDKYDVLWCVCVCALLCHGFDTSILTSNNNFYAYELTTAAPSVFCVSLAAVAKQTRARPRSTMESKHLLRDKFVRPSNRLVMIGSCISSFDFAAIYQNQQFCSQNKKYTNWTGKKSERSFTQHMCAEKTEEESGPLTTNMCD